MSTLLKLQLIVCALTRFIHNCRNFRNSRKGHFTLPDLKSATLSILIKHVQHLHFAQDLSKIKYSKLPAKYFRKLNVFLDDEEILRVGGRLSKTTSTYDQKHPALLPRHHRLTTLIVEHFHKTYLHPGASISLDSKVLDSFTKTRYSISHKQV